MGSYKRRSNKLEGVKGAVSFILIFSIISLAVYLIFMSQTKRQATKVVTDPIVLTNPGGVVSYEIDEETMEEIDDETGLKDIFKKLTGKIMSGDK